MGVTRHTTSHLYESCMECPLRGKLGECKHESLKPGNNLCHWYRKVRGKNYSCPKNCPLKKNPKDKEKGLVVKEFDQTEVIRSSDGSVIKELSSQTMVALYDTNKVSEKEVLSAINKNAENVSAHTNLVILPKPVWDELHRMITENYKMEKK